MIWNYSVCVAEYNPDTDEYDVCWHPSEKELKDIMWILTDEFDKE